MDSEPDGRRTHSANGGARCPKETVKIGNGSTLPLLQGPNGDSKREEGDGLLQEQAVTENGEAPGDPERAQGQIPPQKGGVVCRMVHDLRKPVCWKFKVWMILLLSFVVIVAVILISLATCAALHDDEDDEFDPSLFTVPRHFNGSLRMPNMVFSEELLGLSSNESQTLAADLQDKLSGLYRSSAALGRYFSSANITAFRNGSVISDYELRFMLPDSEPLRRFVVTREMVYNVLRQFLFDQETPESDPAYVDPLSLVMF